MAIPGNMLSTTTEAIDPSTTGWLAVLNCAVGLGSGGRNGPGCLKMTSSAAGEMQARTQPMYPVTAGQLYFTLADTSSSTQAERIGIRWLSAANAQIGVTWSLTTAAASSSWHRVSVAGQAPVGAVRAQVVLSATVDAAGRLHFWENVYFGLPIRRKGESLLSFNAEAGGELDTSAWAAGANCSVSRVAPVTSWSVDYFYAGGHQVALTVTANGDAHMLCVERPPVAPGVDYAVHALLNPPTSGSAAWVEIRFYNAAGAQVAAARSTLAAPGTGFYAQIASAVAPSDAATASIAVGITGATAGQMVRADGMFLGPAASMAGSFMHAGTVVPMADWGFEQGAGAWAVASGVGTLARSTPWGTHGRFGSYALLLSSSTATTSVLRSGLYPIGDTAGLNWHAEVSTKVVAGGWTYSLGFRWYDAANALLSTDTGTVAAAGTPNWWSRFLEFDAPANATQVQLELTLTATSPSSVVAFDGVGMWQALPVIEAEALDDAAAVQVVLRDLDVGDLLSLYRVRPGGARTLVRGPSGMIDAFAVTSDSFTVTDYEAPLGVPLVYQAELRNPTSGAVTGTRRADPVALADPGGSMIWLKDPVEPQRNLCLMEKTPPNWQREIEAGEFRVRGRRNSVILTDVRQGYTGDMEVFTRTDEERRLLHWLLDTGHPIFIQTGPGTGIDDTYVAVGQAVENRLTSFAPEPWREWTLPMTEVERPDRGQAGSALRTWQDVRLDNATWGMVLERYATWLDVLLDRPKAVR